jgi:plastocyanin
MRRLASSILIILVTAALAACGGGGTPSPASSAATNPSVAAPSVTAGSPAAGASVASAGACATAPAGSTAAVTVDIKGFAYAPASAQAKVGDVVAWKNDDSVPHSATMDAGTCDTDTISAGSSAMLVFTAAGTYTYHCKVHPGQMKDVTVVVQ